MSTEQLNPTNAIKALKPIFDANDVKKALQHLVEPTNVFELRLLEARAYNATKPWTFSGYFNDIDTAVNTLSGIAVAKGIYVTLNPVIPDLLAIRRNRLDVAKSGESTSDQQILKRRWLLIDCDPKKISPLISATNLELGAAIHRANAVEAFLAEHGFPTPIKAESGNGAHLLYRVDLPTDDKNLVKEFLTALAAKFDDNAVSIDRSVFNAARIVKLYGTLACKGEDTTDRPHRMSRITNIPAELKVVELELLEMFTQQYAVAAVAPTITASTVTYHFKNDGRSEFDVRTFLQKHGVGIRREHRKGTQQVIELKTCPFNPEHGGHGEVAVFIKEDGKLGFKCHHNSCEGKTWKEFRQHYETTPSDRRDVTNASSSSAAVKNAATDVCKVILEITTDGNLAATEAKTKVGKEVVAILAGRGRFYYDLRYRDCSTAMYFDAVSKKLLRVESDEFLCWLANWTGVNAANTLFDYIKEAVKTEAVAGGTTTGITPEVYWAARPGEVYISNGDGQMVKISAGKVDLVNNGTDGILFPVGGTLPAWKLVDPVDPFDKCTLFSGARFADDNGRILLKLWALSLPLNPICKPPLVTSGPIRSGKTRIARGIFELYGLPFAAGEPKATEKNESDFWVNLDAGGIYCLDNCDSRVDWLADAIAAASTGTGEARRKLYKDTEKIELKPRAWLILTAMNPMFAGDVGLADRLLVVRMLQRDAATKTSDSALSVEIAEKRDAGLSFIADTISKALADTAPVPEGLNLRHPDYAAFAAKLGRSMNCEAATIAALQSAETDKSRFCLENDPVGKALLDFIPSNPLGFEGSASALLADLAHVDNDFSPDAKGARGNPYWNSKRLGKKLGLLWQYIETVFDAKKQLDRVGVTIYTIKVKAVAGYAGFETLKQEKSPHGDDIGGLAGSAKETQHTQQQSADAGVNRSERIKVSPSLWRALLLLQ